MPDKGIAEKLMDRVPLAVLVIGVFVFIIGAAGGLPIGNPPLQIADTSWRVALGIVGLILSFTGLLLILSEGEFPLLSVGAIKRLDRSKEVGYLLKRIAEAEESVDDLTWAQPDKLTTGREMSKADVDTLLDIVIRITKKSEVKFRYREIMVFYGSEDRTSKARKLITDAGAGYHLAGYADLPEPSPPSWQFVIIDKKEVILPRLAVRHPKIVRYFCDYYDSQWDKAVKMKIGDQVRDLGLLEEAEKKLNRKKVSAG